MSKLHSGLARRFMSISLLLGSCLVQPSASFADELANRIVSIGGSVTEIIYALEEQDRLIARDSTSLFPETATKLPDVGYIRRLSPEGVLSVEPDLIVTLEGAGPPEAVSVLKSAKIDFVSIPESFDANGIKSKIKMVGQALNRPEKAEILSAKFDAEIAELVKLTSKIKQPKKVLFVLSASGGKILASGIGTAASGVIELAGATSAVSEFSGYKALTDEAIVTAAPDVILMMNRRGDHSSSDAELIAHPSIALTPAAKSGNIIRMDGLYLLGFGPRTARAAKDLAQKIYGDVVVSK